VAGGGGNRVSARGERMKFIIRSRKRAVVQRCPIPETLKRPEGPLGFAQESLHRCPSGRPMNRLAFSRHDGIYRSDGAHAQNLGAGAASRWSAPGPSKGCYGRNYASCSSSAMSSGRLFLDRVARQQSPSLLHRHPELSTHSPEPIGEGDVSILPGWGHFYFALTRRAAVIDRCTANDVVSLIFRNLGGECILYGRIRGWHFFCFPSPVSHRRRPT
jgi:hypothetical protein